MVDSFQNSLRLSNIKCATLDLDDLSKLFEIIKNHNEESKKHQLEFIDENRQKADRTFTDEEVGQFKNNLINKYVVGAEIYTKKGQYSRSFNPDDAFDKKKIPDDVIKLIISNTFLFNIQKEFIQPYKIIVELDFGRTTLLDLASNPSYETYNSSKVEIWGLVESWVDGVHDKIIAYFKERENNRQWLHRKNIYDIFLWLLIIPIIFWNMIKIDYWLKSKILETSSVISVFIYIYIFIITLLVFNLIFKYLRHSFPPLELKSNLNAKGKYIRFIMLTVASGIGVKYLIDIVIGIISFLL